jgi:histone chaperone ASF1
VLDNPTNFANPFQFEITFECLQELDEDLEWKVIYVGKAEDSSSDLILDEILVGPVPVGVNKFVLQADSPDPKKLGNELLGVTVVLVTCSYREREFVRVGYYVNNEYEDYIPEEGPPPSPLDIRKVTRQILADKPRVTKFPIPWGDNEEDDDKPPEPELGEEGEPIADGADEIVDQSMLDQEEDEDDEEDEPDGEEAEEEDIAANE